MASNTRASSQENAAGNEMAVAYLRTSSRTNIDGDSAERQRQAIMAYAKAAGLQVVEEFNDAAVSGADPLNEREGFTSLLAYAEEHGVRTIIVEMASLFARDIVVQETGYRLLAGAGFRLIAADSPNSFLDDTPTAKMIRQILGVVSEFEKANLVAKLKGARDRASAAAGHRIEGRKGYDETHPEIVKAAKRLARKNPKTGKTRSLREIAAELAALGYKTASGKEFSAGQVQRLLA